jgi:hypothetical protein
VLPACKHGWHTRWCLALLKNGPVTESTTSAWITLTAGPKHAAPFCMISHLYGELHQGGLVWFWGFASELELGCSPPCQIPCGLNLVPVTGRSTSPYRRPLHTKRKSGFGALCGGRGWERVAFHASAAECTAPHSHKPDICTAQAATLSSSNSALLPPIEHSNAF